MKAIITLAAALLCLGVATPSAAEPAIHRLDGSVLAFDKANAIADAELKAANVAGAELAILDRGKIVWLHAFGWRDAATRLSMTVDTNIWAASITKSVFATWVMRRVERGQVDLDRPLVKMLARPLTAYESYGAAAADAVRDPNWTSVTPRMTLTHTSGLANLLYLEQDGKLHLHFRPGARFAYSGDGLNILQLALEDTLHVKLADAMQTEIFAPLGMTQTSMIWQPAFAANTALRYGVKGTLIGATHRNKALGAGSMTTSARDLGRFLEAFLANRIVSADTRAKMLSPQIYIHTAYEFPSLNTTKGTEGAKVGLAYGLGWGLLTRTKYGRAFFKEGHGDGAENYVICFERSGICMIILTNSDNGELAFRPLLETLIGDTVTPWVWEGYTREAVLHNEEHTAK
jgi:CubicO group peptidase (beta-lactamase class C family)